MFGFHREMAPVLFKLQSIHPGVRVRMHASGATESDVEEIRTNVFGRLNNTIVRE